MYSGRARALGQILAPSACLIAVALIGLLLDSYWQYVLSLSITAAVVGGALAMLVGYARCITLATGAMLAIGAYGATLPILDLGAPFLAALAFSTALGAVAGLLLAVPGVRFRNHNLAMVTFVFQAVVIIVLRESKGLTGGAEGIHVPPPVIFNFAFKGDASFLILSGVLLALVIAPIAILLTGPFGKHLRAVASNENAARAFGINVRHHLIAAFAWSSAVIAFAGAVAAPRVRIIDPDSYGVMMSIFALSYPIIGGMGSIWGGLFGGALLRLIPEVLRPLADYIDLVFCVLVVGTLTFFPEGLASALWSRRRDGGGAARSIRAVADVGAAGVHGLGWATPSPATLLTGDRDTDPVLLVRSVSKSFGALRAVNNLCLTVRRGALHGVMGPNGAGKTTLFNLISGFDTPDAGTVLMGETSLQKVPIEGRIGLGMTRTFQHSAVFRRLSCLDNVTIGLGKNGVWRGMRRSVAAAVDSRDTRVERDTALSALEAVGLGARAHALAGTMSLGDQRRLEIARAIVSRPRIILLDEPVSGVSAEESERLRDLLVAVNRELGVAMLVIEHNIGFLVSLCQRISVMSEGHIIAEGDAAAMVEDPRVRQVYFGETEAAA
jgi:branched-chain amino acid transport system permease protein